MPLRRTAPAARVIFGAGRSAGLQTGPGSADAPVGAEIINADEGVGAPGKARGGSEPNFELRIANRESRALFADGRNMNRRVPGSGIANGEWRMANGG